MMRAIACLLLASAACGGRSELAAEATALDAGTTIAHDAAARVSRDAAAPVFPVGPYACDSDLLAELPHVTSSGGSFGTLRLTQEGWTVTATYSDNPSWMPGVTEPIYVHGTLAFTATTDAYAEPSTSGQTFTLLCITQLSGTEPSAAMAIAAASPTLDGPTLVVSFTGTTEAPCAGADVTGTIT
jgi:hypothetical protein